MNIIDIKNDFLSLDGRVYILDNAYVFDNSNTGFSCIFEGTSFNITFKANCSIGENKVLLIVDNIKTKITLPNTNEFISINLCNNLENNKHSLQFIKLLEDQYSRIYINEINCNKLIKYDSNKNNIKIEFFGDSLTCGFGVLGHDNEISSFNEDSSYAFPYLTASILEAKLSTHSYSGISLDLPMYADILMKDYFDYYSFTSKIKYNHIYNPDIIVIYLGTNDSAGINNNKGNIDSFKNSYIKLINQLDEYNQNIPIILCYGMCKIREDIDNTIKSLENINDDIYVCKFTPIDIGSVNHPGVLTHKDASIKLSNLIKKILNLK